MGKTKRVVAMGDFHCGHMTGLTPPSRHDQPPKDAPESRKKAAKRRQQLWSIFQKEIKALGKIDILICNGDLIDGRQEKSGGGELLVLDRDQQADMAEEIIRFVNADHTVITAGTPYHVGKCEDWERLIALHTKADFEGEAFINVNGVHINAKHKIGSSQIPHGRHTATARDVLWNKMWAADNINPEADVLIRSHVHFFQYAGTRNKLYMTLPALQGLGGKYGVRQCSGIVDWGFCVFDIGRGGVESWHWVIPSAANQVQQARVLKL